MPAKQAIECPPEIFDAGVKEIAKNGENTYDGDGNRLTASYYTDDRVSHYGYDTFTIYTYDSNRNILTLDTDMHIDGTIDDSATYTYDADNNMLTWERSGYNGTGNGYNTYDNNH